MVAESVLDVAAWLVTYALHSTALLLAALLAFALITRAARRSPRLADAAPAWRERIGKVALLAGVATASVQTALGIEPFGLRPALVEVTDSAVVVGRIPAPVGIADTGAGEPTTLALLERSTKPVTLASPFELVPVGSTSTAALASVPVESASLSPFDAWIASTTSGRDDGRSLWIAAFLAAWALVACAAFVRRFVGWRALSLSLSDAQPVTDPDALARFDDLCRRAGVRRSGRRAAVLSVAPHLASPVTRGLVVPEICLPPRALRDLDADEFDALLGHEIAHAARRDPAWLAVFRMLEVVFCLQPLNRVVARRIEDDAELLCDDRAVVWTGDRLPLASCLTEVASWLVPPAREPRLAVGMAAHGARLSRRVERLVDEGHRPDAGARHPLLTAAAIVFAASTVAVVPGFAAQRSAKPLPLGLKLELALASTPTADSEAGSDAALVDDGSDELPAVLDLDAPPDAEESAPAISAPVISAQGAEGPDDSAGASPLGSVLDELEREIVTLRAGLHERVGGLALERDLDALARRVGELRAREASLVAALARTPNILLSPDVAGRSAEDQ